MPRQKLTLFDLDNTLLTGDSDVLWCDFLIKQGILDREEFSAHATLSIMPLIRAGSMSKLPPGEMIEILHGEKRLLQH